MLLTIVKESKMRCADVEAESNEFSIIALGLRGKLFGLTWQLNCLGWSGKCWELVVVVEQWCIATGFFFNNKLPTLAAPINYEPWMVLGLNIR